MRGGAWCEGQDGQDVDTAARIASCGVVGFGMPEPTVTLRCVYAIGRPRRDRWRARARLEAVARASLFDDCGVAPRFAPVVSVCERLGGSWRRRWRGFVLG